MHLRERLFGLEAFGIKLGLDNIQTILTALHRPDRRWPSIHVAGTNGKGSVTAMVERGLRASGYRTGRYTSPHLDRIEERIALDGAPVEPQIFDRATADLFAAVDRLIATGELAATPTFFEVTTAIAFEIFARAQVTAAVIEVGLGGRFDATNVITPATSAITSIAFDHERHLGHSLAAIAFEKAGIIKPGIPVVVGDVPGEAADVIRRRADAVGAPRVDAGPSIVARAELRRGRATVSLATPAGRYEHVRLGLNGAHQVANAAVAARTLEVFAERGHPIAPDAIVRGLTDVEWPARLEWLRTVDGHHVLVDAAHNPAGAAALAAYLHAAEAAPLPLVISVMQDKAVDTILAQLISTVSSIVATQADSPRAMAAADLSARIAALWPSLPVLTMAEPEAALARALKSDGRAIVAGSIFLAGPLRARLVERGATTVDEPA